MRILLYDLCARDKERRFSPNCWKVRMALAHKGLEFETRPTPFTGIRDIGNGFSPTVPVIDDGGTLVRDSFEIALYLEDAYPDRPSLFKGDGGKSEARFVESWVISVVNASLFSLIVKDIHDQLDDADQAYFRESREAMFGMKLEDVQVDKTTGMANLTKTLKPFDEVLSTNNFLGGDNPTYADFLVFGILKWMDIVSTYRALDDTSPTGHWFMRLQNLYGGHAASVPTVRGR